MKRTIRGTAQLAMILVLVVGQLPLTAMAGVQTTRASIQGRVTDEKGSVITDVRVIARNTNTGITREATTDGDGRFRIPELTPGIYEVRAERDGFRPEVHRNIELTVGLERVLEIALEVGSIREEVVIEANVQQVETTTSAISHLVNQRQIEELPLNGRDVLQLATLQPGVVSMASIGTTQEETGAGTIKLAINGSRLDANGFYLDGTETVDAFGYSPGGLGGGFLGVDALKEFQVLTSNYSAEFGQGGGAIINAVTKSGTNELHGTAFWFLRNSALDARNFFNADKLPFKRNQFGGSLGGPIVKNRTFFFGNYEGLRRREGTSSIFFVPSPAAREGRLTSGNIAVSPVARPYVNLYPLPNGPILGDTGELRRDVNESTNEDYAMIRIDHRITDSHSLFGRYTYNDSDLKRVAGVILDQILTNKNQYVTLEQQSILSPRALNSIRFGYSRGDFASEFPFTVDVPPELSFIPGQPLGAFSISGVTPLRQPLHTPRQFVLNTIEVNDQFIYSRGAHSFKFGGLVRRYQLNANSPLVPDGIFIFGGGLDRLLRAQAQVLFAPLPNTDFYRGIRQTLFGFYAQDDWRVRPNLILNLGLRYEPISTPTEVNGKVSNLRNLSDTVSTVGDPFIDNPSKKNFAPRVGFAWDPTGQGQWSIRSGFGIYYANIRPMQYRFQISNQPPFAGLLLLPGIFPDAYTRAIDNPIPLPGLIWAMDFNAAQPTVYQWNASVQRQLTNSLLVDASYVGARGIHLPTGPTINVRADFELVNGRKFFPPGPGTRVNPSFGSMQLLTFDGDSYYHGLQLSASQSYRAGLQFQFSYTFAKSIDTGSAHDTVLTNGTTGGDAQDPFDSRSERSRSDFDVKHNFVANFLWDLPFGAGRAIGSDVDGFAGKLIEGWGVGGILNLRSGFPFTVGLGFDRARSGIDNVQALRPNVTPGRSYESAITGRADGYVDPTAFELQPAGFYGDATRNALTGPNLQVFDFSVVKRTPINERVRTEFRFEAFNIFNITNLAPPGFDERVVFTGVDAQGRGIVPSQFGQLTRTATTSRQLQFGLKFIW